MKSKLFSGLKPYFFVTLYGSDVGMYVLSFIISFTFIFGHIMNIFTMSFVARFGIFSLIVLLLNYIAFGLYKDKRNMFDENDFMKILYSAMITYFMLIIFIKMFVVEQFRVIELLTIAIVINIILTSFGRIIMYKIISKFRQLGYDRKKIYIYGDDGDTLKAKLEENKDLGYDVLGVTNSVTELKSNLDKVNIIFVTKNTIDERMTELIIGNSDKTWKIIPSAYNLIMDEITFDEFKDYPVVNIKGVNVGNYVFVKRIMDVTLSGLALVILSPLLLLIALSIKVFMPGPIFFKQERLGKDLKPFNVYKFRSMVVNAEELKKKLQKKNEVKGLFKMKKDPRVTRLGSFLRRSCLDELAQLINIFNGDMSIVGPRPHLESELDHFKGWRRARFNVKPGLSGMWQVNGRHELNFDKAILYDIYYTKHMSFVLDITIILKTIPSILFGRGKF